MNDPFVYYGGMVKEGVYEQDQFTNAMEPTYNYQNQCRTVEYYSPHDYPETPMESWYLDNMFASEDPMDLIEPELTNDIDTPTSFSMRVSTSFLPDSHPAHMPDLVLITSDSVQFHVCTSLIISQSPHAFETMLVSPLVGFKHEAVSLDISSDELNVIMHITYGTSAVNQAPTLSTIVAAIDRMPLFDMTPKDYLVPDCPFYSLLLTHTPLEPMTIYCLAGRHHLEDLAVNSSGYLLSISPDNITDEQAKSMGAVALKRLLLLHSNRVESLRNLLLQVPKYHPVTDRCSFMDQRAVSRSWKMASAAILWVAGPDIPSSEIQDNLGSLARVVHCKKCSEMIQDRVKGALKAWLDLKRTV